MTKIIALKEYFENKSCYTSMVLTSEYRSSNVVEVEGTVIPVSQIDTMEAILALKPVVLTIEWFERAGFKKNAVEVYKTDPRTGNVFCIDRIDDEFYFNTGTFKKKLEYWHQVQNLYLDLMGEELVVVE